jgi:hypothetical protein
MPRIRSERPAFDLHHPEIAARFEEEKHGKRAHKKHAKRKSVNTSQAGDNH